MKLKRFSRDREKELRETDNESFIDENGVLHACTAKMAIQDLAMIAHFEMDVMKRYYTGDIKDVDYSIVEVLMDGLSNIPVRHRVSSFEHIFYIEIKYSPDQFYVDDYIPIELAAHILSLTTDEIISRATDDNRLFRDDNDCLFVEVKWLMDIYQAMLCASGNRVKVSFRTDKSGEISIIIERELK